MSEELKPELWGISSQSRWYGPAAICLEHLPILPESSRTAVAYWIMEGSAVGDFLLAVITNDLRKTVALGDPENVAALRDYVTYFHNFTPSGCWGNEVSYRTWRDAGGIKGINQGEMRANAEKRDSAQARAD